MWIEKEKKLYGLNASGRSPFNWNLDKLKRLGLSEIPTYGALSWSVPGCVSGWNELAKKFGSKKPAELLESAIHYSEQGFPVSPIIARDWRLAMEDNYANLANTYAPDGKIPRLGDIFKNQGIADFFKILSRDGFEAFYQGEIADRIVNFSRKN